MNRVLRVGRTYEEEIEVLIEGGRVFTKENLYFAKRGENDVKNEKVEPDNSR
jgi:hypothetical protein